MSDLDGPLTADDVRDLNRASVERAAAFVRIAGTVVLIIGVVAAAAWLWATVRAQQQLAPPTLAFGDDHASSGVSWVDRVDLLAPYVGSLVIAAAAAGFGLMLRLFSDFLVERVGGTTTGFVVGDRISTPLSEE